MQTVTLASGSMDNVEEFTIAGKCSK